MTGRASLRFALVLALFAGAVALLFRDAIVGPLVQPLRLLTAQAVLVLIQQVGLEAFREAGAIYHPGGFAYEISRGCLGLVPVGFLVVSVLAYPGTAAARKLMTLAVGVPLVLALNLMRLAHLFYLGVYQADLFHVAHQVVWQGVMVLAVFLLWLVATGWSAHPVAGRAWYLSGKGQRPVAQ